MASSLQQRGNNLVPGAQAGRKAVPFEILVGGDCMDFCSPAGFANAVYQTLRTSPGGGALHAPVCSTWVFMSRGSTLRSPTRPLGRGDSQKVADGNLHVARCGALPRCAKGIFWLLEQPSTSIMETHPSFQKMLKILHVRKLIFDMKDFGANTQKRTILYSSALPLFVNHPVSTPLTDTKTVSCLWPRPRRGGRPPAAQASSQAVPLKGDGYPLHGLQWKTALQRRTGSQNEPDLSSGAPCLKTVRHSSSTSLLLREPFFLMFVMPLKA